MELSLEDDLAEKYSLRVFLVPVLGEKWVIVKKCSWYQGVVDYLVDDWKLLWHPRLEVYYE